MSKLIKRSDAPKSYPETAEERELRIYGDNRCIANKVDRFVKGEK